MINMVLFISLLVHIYSYDYMHKDPYFIRFLSYLTLFTFFMLILLTGGNFLILFLGWEGVGLSSYLLIGFWNTRVQANKAALKALLVNRISDMVFLFGIILIFFFFRTLNFNAIFILVPFFSLIEITIFNYQFFLLDFISFPLFIGAVGKSAQIGLHIWLPDAMEGPTPVSALIHAATMVTAGIYLIIRCSFIIEYSQCILFWITFFGAKTVLYASILAISHYDIKKVIAYSTCSQLGYMFLGCGVSVYSSSLFHLINHAFFKALLFLIAGIIIHYFNNEQDIRNLGKLCIFIPYIYICFVIASFSLMGFPYLSGFYSKDFIIEILYVNLEVIGIYAFILSVFAVFFTCIYSLRLIYFIFLNDINYSYNTLFKKHNFSYFSIVVLFLLLLGSIFSGYILKELLIGFGNNFLSRSVLTLPRNFILNELEFIPYSIKMLPTFIFIISLIFFYFFNNRCFYENYLKTFEKNNFKFLILFKNLHLFLSNNLYFDYIYNFYISKPFLFKSYDVFIRIVDKGLLELIFIFYISNNLYNFFICYRLLKTGNIFNYVNIILFFLYYIIILLLFFLN